jgi:outer membrane protein assembly factor BamD (BamD/ComL family)
VSIVGILASNLFAGVAAPTHQNAPSNFEQIKNEFQQLGQDLQSGNLTQAQQDYTALSQNVQGAAQSNTNPVLQAFNQLGTDLQSGNLQAAQKDYTTLQQDVQQNAARAGAHHGHHHHATGGSQSASSQQSDPIAAAFNTLSQDLQAGNLSAAQSAFATLTNDLQQIGGFTTPASSAGSSVPASSTGLSVNA